MSSRKVTKNFIAMISSFLSRSSFYLFFLFFHSLRFAFLCSRVNKNYFFTSSWLSLIFLVSYPINYPESFSGTFSCLSRSDIIQARASKDFLVYPWSAGGGKMLLRKAHETGKTVKSLFAFHTADLHSNRARTVSSGKLHLENEKCTLH
jgi:hypothetical protein